MGLIKLSSGHSNDGQFIVKQWGVGTDVPVADDYDGDGQTDIAVWRATDGNWYILHSSTNTAQVIAWGSGQLNDQTVPGDYDGDGKADATVWRPSNCTWYIKCSGDQTTLIKAQGQHSDMPIADRPIAGKLLQ